MFRKILVPLDGSNLAETVLSDVLGFRKVFDSEIILFHAISDAGLPPAHRDRIVSEMKRVSLGYLNQIVSRLKERGVSPRIRVMYDEPAEAILTAAVEEGVDLLAMSTHARADRGNWFLGSVTGKVRSHSPVPLFIARAGGKPCGDWAANPEAPVRRLLLPLDGSALAEEAIPYGLEIARSFDAQVVLLRAVVIPHVPGLDAGPLIEAARSEAEEYLDEVSTRLEGHGRPVVKAGSPADTIVAVAEEQDVDLIAMTTHGRSGLRRFLLGGVADRVIRAGRTPLLLIRNPNPDRGGSR